MPTASAHPDSVFPGSGALGAVLGEMLAWVAIVVGVASGWEGLTGVGAVGIFLFPLIGGLLGRLLHVPPPPPPAPTPSQARASSVVAGAFVGFATTLGVIAALAIVAIFLLAGPGGAGLWGVVGVLWVLVLALPILLLLLVLFTALRAHRATRRPPGAGPLGAAFGEIAAWVAMVLGWGAGLDGLFGIGVAGVFLFPLIGWSIGRRIAHARYER